MEEIKEQMTDYWSKRTPAFSELRVKEFRSGKRKLWLDEFNKYLPDQKPLKILDVGTEVHPTC
jgi:hypothetical protein